MDEAEAKAAVHDAIGGLIDSGEIAIAWCLVIDVAGQGDVRYLAHRAGGGVDGTDAPMAWSALGMLRTSVGVAERQLADIEDFSGDDEDEPA